METGDADPPGYASKSLGRPSHATMQWLSVMWNGSLPPQDLRHERGSVACCTSIWLWLPPGPGHSFLAVILLILPVELGNFGRELSAHAPQGLNAGRIGLRPAPSLTVILQILMRADFSSPKGKSPYAALYKFALTFRSASALDPLIWDSPEAFFEHNPLRHPEYIRQR